MISLLKKILPFLIIVLLNNNNFIKVYEQYPNNIDILGDGFLFSKVDNVIDLKTDGPDTRMADTRLVEIKNEVV